MQRLNSSLRKSSLYYALMKEKVLSAAINMSSEIPDTTIYAPPSEAEICASCSLISRVAALPPPLVPLSRCHTSLGWLPVPRQFSSLCLARGRQEKGKEPIRLKWNLVFGGPLSG